MISLINPTQAFVFYAELNGEVRPLFARSSLVNLTLDCITAEEAIRQVTGQDWRVCYATAETAVEHGFAKVEYER